jgi:hypothetical protein
MASIRALESLRIEEQDLSSGDLRLEADSNESLMIKALGVSGANDNDTMQVAIDEETMLSFQFDNGGNTLFQESHLDSAQSDVLGKLRGAGLDVPMLKVPEGDEFQVINSTSSAGSATVLYSELGPNGVRASEEGAPGNKTRTFVTTGSETITVTADSTVTESIDTSENPGILRDFPYEEDVPPGTEYDLQAIGILEGDGTEAGIEISGFRLKSEEREFLARDSDFVDPAIAPHPDSDLTELPLVFPEQPTFSPGDELDVEVEVSDTDSTESDIVVEIAIVAYRRDLGGI